MNWGDVKAVQLVWLSKTGLTNLNSGEGGSNLVDIKKYRYGGQEFPYVSGQAMRFYLKEAIRRHLNPEEACVADDQGSTCGRIDKCVLCDLFGFMVTVSGVGARTRVSPVKVSPAMGLLPLDDTMVTDFLTRRYRGITAQGEYKMSGDIVNVELAVNVYKAGICIDITRVGCEEEVVKKGEDSDGQDGFHTVELKKLVKEDKERFRRVGLLLDAVKDFSDYSKQSRLLTDFTPDFVLIALQNNYSHRLQKAIELYNDGTARLNTNRLRQVINEVKEQLIVIDKKPALWAGIIDGIVDNVDEVRQVLDDLGIPVLTPAEAINLAKGVFVHS